MIYPDNIESKIGFSTVRNLVSEHCSNSLGKEKCSAMAFSNNYNHIRTQLLQVDEYKTIMSKAEGFPNGSVYDLREELERIRIIGTYLTESELQHLGKTLASAIEIAEFFNEERKLAYPELWKIAESLSLFPHIVALIDRSIDRFGEVKDGASPALRDLRASLHSTVNSVNGLINRVIAGYKSSGIVDSDVTPAVRDGRLVIPVSAMNKRQVKGIVHDESATGKTFFIEPAEIVEKNNKIRELESEIRREIIRILTEITDSIRPALAEILAFYKVIGFFDFIRAKATFAEEIGAEMPHLSKKQEIEWYNAKHPALFLSLNKLGKQTVPLNVKLDPNNRILLISGPNAGGKSVCLKTVGIVQYMLQCGLLPPVYANSHFGIFDNLFIEIGDEQSIENELSTYSSHLSNMKLFMQKANERTLILIDEFGGGTEPQIGGALAQAILRKLNELCTFGVITTHYQNLKNFANETDGIINGAMLYDRQKMQPLFQLSVGTPGSSFAIEIAKKIGISADILEYAESIVGSDYINMDKYLMDITRDRKYWENKRQDIRLEKKKLERLVEKYENDIQKLIVERKEILHDAKAEAKEIISGSNASIENAIHEIKKAQAEREQTKLIRKQIEELKSRLSEGDVEDEKIKALKARIKNKKPKKVEEKPKDEKLSVGDNVTIDGSNSVGKIVEIDKKEAVVEIGNFRSTVKLSKLKRTIRKETAAVSKASSGVAASLEQSRQRQLDFKQEIDVRGMSADEAIQAVSYFIDDAYQFNIKEVRILHGTGYGILRQRIREYLNVIPSVKSFRDEHVQFGGAGITIVTLK